MCLQKVKRPVEKLWVGPQGCSDRGSGLSSAQNSSCAHGLTSTFSPSANPLSPELLAHLDRKSVV